MTQEQRLLLIAAFEYAKGYLKAMAEGPSYMSIKPVYICPTIYHYIFSIASGISVPEKQAAYNVFEKWFKPDKFGLDTVYTWDRSKYKRMPVKYNTIKGYEDQIIYTWFEDKFPDSTYGRIGVCDRAIELLRSINV